MPLARPDLVAVVLAAGAGTRLRPLTDLRPKPLCPVGGVALVDLALDRVQPWAQDVAVNLHHGAEELGAHLERRAEELGAHLDDRGEVHVAREASEALGTAGALGGLRGWIDGRGVLVHNCDVWGPDAADLADVVAGWDGRQPSVLVAAPDGQAVFGPGRGLVATLLPWSEVAVLRAEPSGLYRTTLAPAADDGRLDVVAYEGAFVDCGTPGDYLRANLRAAEQAGGTIVAAGARVTGSVERSVVGEGAVVDGEVRDCVLWPGAVVRRGERLNAAIRAPGLDRDVEV